MIEGKLIYYGDDFSEVYDIRKKVFVEELKYSAEYVSDNEDQEAIQVIVYDRGDYSSNNKKAVAIGRIIYRESYCIIDKIAVLKEFRNKEYGDFTVRMLINKVFTAGIHEVYTNVRPETEEFFKRIGFTRTEDNIESNDESLVRMKMTECDRKSCCLK